jgi:NADP-dependent 3-hydroxy acid dehydrogenase YdfG
MKLQDNVCIIAGAARGLGKCTAERSLDEGAKLALWDSDWPDLSTTYPNRTCKYNVDVTAAALFLVTSLSDRVTCICLAVDSGIHIK